MLNLERALFHLVEGARFATSPAGPVERFTPGLSIAVVVRENGASRVVFCDGFGVKDLRSSEKPGPDTLFPCASLSKPVSATLLAKRGTDWKTVVDPPYKLAGVSKQPTVHDWLSHTSGLPDHAGDLIEDMHPSMSQGEIIRNILQFQTGLKPGEFNYTNFGFTIGCLGAIPKPYGSDWESFSTEVLRELGMQRSTYRFTSAFAPGAGDRVVPHQGEPTESADGGWLWRVVEPHEERKPDRQAPAGGLLSCASDMAVFLQAHLDGAFGPDFPPRKVEHKYGLGWNVNSETISFSHSGAFTLGASTAMRIDLDPEASAGIAILTNGEPAGVPESLAKIFFDVLHLPPGSSEEAGLNAKNVLPIGRKMILDLINKKKNENLGNYSPDVRRPIPATLPQGEVFRGHSDFYGCDVVVERHGDEVRLSMGETVNGQPLWSFPLRCYRDTPDEPLFVYDTTGENEVGPSGVTLHLADGKVRKLVDDWLNQTPEHSTSGSGVGEIVSIA